MYREPGRAAVVGAHTGIDAGEARGEHALELGEREVGDEDLTDLRDHDESLTGDRHVVRRFHVPRQNEHESIAGTEPVVRIDWPREARIELRRRAPENVQPEDGVPAVDEGSVAVRAVPADQQRLVARIVHPRIGARRDLPGGTRIHGARRGGGLTRESSTRRLPEHRGVDWCRRRSIDLPRRGILAGQLRGRAALCPGIGG